MNARILVWTLVATLTLGSASALAQDAAPASGLTLSASNATATGHAGSSITFALAVGSDVGRNVTLSVDPLPDGLTYALDAASFAVGPGKPANAALTVAIAPDAHSDAPIPIHVHAAADDGANASLELALHIEAMPEARIVLSPDPAALSLAPGASAYDNVTITAYDAPARVSIGTFATPGYSASSWPVSFDLQPGVAQSLRVAIDATSNATGGSVTLVASDAAHRESKVAIHVESAVPPSTAPSPTAPSFAIRMEPAAQTIAPGGYATFVLHARATRNVTLDLGVGQMSDYSWSTAFTPLSLDIPAGGEASAKLLVHAPPNASGPVKMDALARARDSLEQHDAWIRVDTANATARSPEPTEHRSFVLGATPQRQPLGPDGTARFTIGAKSSHDITLKLGVGRIQVAGYQAELANDTLDVPAASYAKTELVVTAPENASTDGAASRDVPIEVFAVGPDGERHAVTVHVIAASTVAHSPEPAFNRTEPNVNRTEPPVNRTEPNVNRTEPPVNRTQPTPHRPAPVALNDSAITLALQGFDSLGGLRIQLQIGDRTIELHVGAQLLRQMAEPKDDIGGDTGHHSRAWVMLQIDPEGDAQ